MKEHIQGKLINELRDIAQQFHAHGCLRDKIAACLENYLKEDAEWKLKEISVDGVSMKQNLVENFFVKGAEEALKTCPSIVQQYVILLKDYLEIQKSLTADAIKKLMEVA